MSDITVNLISNDEQMKKAFAIREKVFVIEQKVAPKDEYDEYENESFHFLATDGKGKAIGTARWRYTPIGMKLERFAVLNDYRGRGVGTKLVEAVLAHIHQSEKAANKIMYMHAQLDAIPLYRKFGFDSIGKQFEECGIQHFKMVKLNERNDIGKVLKYKDPMRL